MIRRLFTSILLRAALWHVAVQPTHSQEADDAQANAIRTAIWTAIIPDAFPQDIYTWRVRSDGTYREDGRDALTGTSVEQTLSGAWSRAGARMVLRQDDQPFVFDGVVLGNLYVGTLYFSGRAVSRFCAAKGEQPPTRCDPAASMAMHPPSRKDAHRILMRLSRRGTGRTALKAFFSPS